ncbi:major capsid protein [Brevibacterium otitidis]|uniref:Major capsid protein n=1 Tax=Brevibacterium otitidis TaxID=53364 RepID=A0ABV5X123_9MICO|nr:hypothetical protein GCM10023233_04900 [Brevibacterium otitidis]
MLWTDVIDPADQTGFARQTAEDYEAAQGTLARWLPNRTVDDIDVAFTVGDTGLTEVAEYRSYDAETPIGDTPGGQRVKLELPPLGRKYRWSEYDQLRSRGRDSTEAVQASADRLTRTAARAVVDRLELQRGQSLATGKATIAENEFIANADFGRKPEFTFAVDKKWGAGGDPLTDLIAAAELYSDENGEMPGTILTSTKVVSALIRSDALKGLASVGGTVPSILSIEAVNAILGTHGLPAVTTYNRKVQQGGRKVRVLPENNLFFLPAATDPNAEEGSALGATFLGTTLEAQDARYNLPQADQPGLVVGAYREDDPLTAWIRSAAIGMPVLANANLSMAIEVL